MDENEAMAMAIAQMRCSEGGGPTDPLVGAVLIQEGEVLGQAYRNAEGHAEYTLLKNLPEDSELHGATLYTTLEPCTFRGLTNDGKRKRSCADRILDRKIGKVVIGMLDPNPYILGNGILALRNRDVAVTLFPPARMKEIEEANRSFRQTFGLLSRDHDEESRKILGRWEVATTFEDGSITHEEVFFQRHIGNRVYGIMQNEKLRVKYDFFAIRVAPCVWDYSFKSKSNSMHFDHGSGIIFLDNDDLGRAIGVAHGHFSNTENTAIRVNVTMRRIERWAG